VLEDFATVGRVPPRMDATLDLVDWTVEQRASRMPQDACCACTVSILVTVSIAFTTHERSHSINSVHLNSGNTFRSSRGTDDKLMRRLCEDSNGESLNGPPVFIRALAEISKGAPHVIYA
jgi:hypothetical protein